MFRSLKFVAIALATLFVVEPAIAQYQATPCANHTQKAGSPGHQAQSLTCCQMSESRPPRRRPLPKADCPGSKVLKVKSERGDYVVTLVADGNVIANQGGRADGSSQ